jgi:hypothetical protein
VGCIRTIEDACSKLAGSAAERSPTPCHRLHGVARVGIVVHSTPAGAHDILKNPPGYETPTIMAAAIPLLR